MSTMLTRDEGHNILCGPDMARHGTDTPEDKPPGLCVCLGNLFRAAPRPCVFPCSTIRGLKAMLLLSDQSVTTLWTRVSGLTAATMLTVATMLTMVIRLTFDQVYKMFLFIGTKPETRRHPRENVKT